MRCKINAPAVLARSGRHVKTSITLDINAHVLPGMQVAIAETIGRLLFAPKVGTHLAGLARSALKWPRVTNTTRRLHQRCLKTGGSIGISGSGGRDSIPRQPASKASCALESRSISACPCGFLPSLPSGCCPVLASGESGRERRSGSAHPPGVVRVGTGVGGARHRLAIEPPFPNHCGDHLGGGDHPSWVDPS